MALAISMDAPATPPKPRMPAISATIRNVTTQLSMTQPLFCTLVSTDTRPAIAAHRLQKQSGFGTKVPDFEGSGKRSKSRYPGNKIECGCRNDTRAPGGIKPVKSARKTLYALQSCYEGSPSRPRGAIVGGRRFAYDRAEQADASRRPRSPACGGWYCRARARVG